MTQTKNMKERLEPLWTEYLVEMIIMAAIVGWCVIACGNLPHTPEFWQRLQIAAYAIGLLIGLDVALTLVMTRVEAAERYEADKSIVEE